MGHSAGNYDDTRVWVYFIFPDIRRMAIIRDETIATVDAKLPPHLSYNVTDLDGCKQKQV